MSQPASARESPPRPCPCHARAPPIALALFARPRPRRGARTGGAPAARLVAPLLNAARPLPPRHPRLARSIASLSPALGRVGGASTLHDQEPPRAHRGVQVRRAARADVERGGADVATEVRRCLVVREAEETDERWRVSRASLSTSARARSKTSGLQGGRHVRSPRRTVASPVGRRGGRRHERGVSSVRHAAPPRAPAR